MIIGGSELNYVPSKGVWHNWRNTARVHSLTAQDAKKRRTPARHVILHTTRGLPKSRSDIGLPTMPGSGPLGIDKAISLSRWWANNGSAAGAHIIVAQDGAVLFLADLLDDEAYHAPPFNASSIGIEMLQDPDDGLLYQDQLEATLEVVDVVTAIFEVRRVIPGGDATWGPGGPLPFTHRQINNLGGVWGHRDVTTRRYFGDPGDAIFDVLEEAKYRRVNWNDVNFSYEQLRLATLLSLDDLRLPPALGDYKDFWGDVKGSNLPRLCITRPVDYHTGVQRMMLKVRNKEFN